MPGFALGPFDGSNNVPAPSGPVFTYTWRLIGIADNGEDIRGRDIIVYPKEATLPEFSVETENYRGPSIDYKYASKVTWPDVRINFYDTRGLAEYLKAKKDTVWTPEGGMAIADKYKFTSRIEVYLSDGETLEQDWTLYGSWVRSISWSQLTYANSDMHNATVVIAYDWAEQK
jgi:hypothetical protein